MLITMYRRAHRWVALEHPLSITRRPTRTNSDLLAKQELNILESSTPMMNLFKSFVTNLHHVVLEALLVFRESSKFWTMMAVVPSKSKSSGRDFAISD